MRNLPAFSSFLIAAAIADTEIVNFTNIAAECRVSNNTVKSYYEILVDAMHGDWLPAFRKRPKRRVTRLPKFYFADVGVVNVLARRRSLESRSPGFGRAFECWVLHELRTYIEDARLREGLSYWRLSSGIEVDIIVGDMRVAIEAKATRRIARVHLKGLRNLLRDHPEIRRRVIVSLEDQSYVTDDHIEVMNAKDFIARLWGGELVGSR